MFTVKEPSLVKLREDPFCDRIESILLRPLSSGRETTSELRFEVTYEVGHIVYYELGSNFELFENLMRHMVDNNNKYQDMLIKEFRATRINNTLLKVMVIYENNNSDYFEFELYDEEQPRCVYNKDADTLKWLEARALLYQCGERHYQYTQGGWSKIQSYAM